MSQLDDFFDAAFKGAENTIADDRVGTFYENQRQSERPGNTFLKGIMSNTGRRDRSLRNNLKLMSL